MYFFLVIYCKVSLFSNNQGYPAVIYYKLSLFRNVQYLLAVIYNKILLFSNYQGRHFWSLFPNCQDHPTAIYYNKLLFLTVKVILQLFITICLFYKLSRTSKMHFLQMSICQNNESHRTAISCKLTVCRKCKGEFTGLSFILTVFYIRSSNCYFIQIGNLLKCQAHLMLFQTNIKESIKMSKDK